MQYKDNRVVKNLNMESKEEQRMSLYCNKTTHRCSSLDNDRTFSKKEIDAFIDFAKILKRIHVRLIMEGYTIENGKITPPKQPHK